MRSIPAMSTMPTTNVLSAFFPNRRQQRVVYQNNANNMKRDVHNETENITPNRPQQHENEHYESTSEDEMIQMKRIVNKVDTIVASAASTPTNSSTAASSSIRDIIDETYNDLKTRLVLGNDNTMAIQASPYHQQHNDDDESTVDTATTATTATMSSASSTHSTNFLLNLSANASIHSELSLSSSLSDIQSPVLPPSHIVVSQQQQSTDYLPLEIIYSNDQWDIKNQWGFDYDDEMMDDDTDSLSSSSSDDDDFFGNNNIFDNTPFAVNVNHSDGIQKYCNYHRVIHRRLNNSYDECFPITTTEINNDNVDNNTNNITWTIQYARPIVVVDDNDDNIM